MAPEALPSLLSGYREAAEAAYPGALRELDGMARGAGAPWWELFAVNVLEEIENHVSAGATGADRCTSVAVAGARGTFLGHNEQWYAGDGGNVAVVVARPEEGPAFASPTIACCLPAVGMNANGFAQGVMSLQADDERVGVPRVFQSRASLDSRDPADAVRRATLEGRAGGYGYLFAGAGGRTVCLETSATDHAVVPDASAHANHYLDPALAAAAPEPFPGSVGRLERARTLLEQRAPAAPDHPMSVLRDHEGMPQAICLHPDPARDGEGSAILFSMVCEVEARRMWVANGNPCEAGYAEIHLEESFA
jgi:isopenicillin-N N-acyltransferase like protein